MPCKDSKKRKAYQKEYCQRPEVKIHERERQRRPQIKAYYQSPEYRARKKEYRQRPEVKAKKKLRMALYSQRPEIKAHERERQHWPKRIIHLEERRLKRTYGLTLSEKNAMLEKQDGKCAICKTDKFNGRGPVVDHDHMTGKVRGILCINCNTALGYMKENVIIFRNAINYLAPFRG